MNSSEKLLIKSYPFFAYTVRLLVSTQLSEDNLTTVFGTWFEALVKQQSKQISYSGFLSNVFCWLQLNGRMSSYCRFDHLWNPGHFYYHLLHFYPTGLHITNHFLVISNHEWESFHGMKVRGPCYGVRQPNFHYGSFYIFQHITWSVSVKAVTTNADESVYYSGLLLILSFSHSY